jgi:hypothetical protein
MLGIFTRSVWILHISYSRQDYNYLGFEVLTALVMNIAIIWNIASCSPYVNRRFGGIIPSIFKVESQPSKKPECSRRLDRMALKIELIRSSEESVHIWTAQRYIPEDWNIGN